MKSGQTRIIQQTVAAVIGWTMVAGLAASANASGPALTVAEVTDWGTTPMEIVNADLPYAGYNGGVYAGINTLSVNNNGAPAIYSAFCIDPFHLSATGPSSPYYMVPLASAPKAPAPLNAATALQIRDLWAEFYSPTMSSPNAAGLQIAIWELVSSNAVANDGLPANDAFSLDGGNDYGAARDIASLATYNGQPAQLMALTGPGQDFVVDPVPDGGGTFIMLTLALSGLVLARPALLKNAGQLRIAQAIPANRTQAR